MHEQAVFVVIERVAGDVVAPVDHQDGLVEFRCDSFRDDRALKPVRPADITLVPYYAWANREQGAMTVWLPVFP